MWRAATGEVATRSMSNAKRPSPSQAFLTAFLIYRSYNEAVKADASSAARHQIALLR